MTFFEFVQICEIGWKIEEVSMQRLWLFQEIARYRLKDIIVACPVFFVTFYEITYIFHSK